MSKLVLCLCFNFNLSEKYSVETAVNIKSVILKVYE